MTEFSKDYQPSDESRKAGRKKRQSMSELLALALEREVEGAQGEKTKRGAVIANQLVSKAAEGDIQAIKEVFDRIDGKAKQILAGDPDNPIVERIERIITRRSD